MHMHKVRSRKLYKSTRQLPRLNTQEELTSGEESYSPCKLAFKWFFYNVKGITSSICQLLFVNATFKVGPSSSAQSTRASGGPTCSQSDDWSPRFYRVSYLTPCTLLLAEGYTPLPKDWCPETSWTQQNKKIQAEGQVSADTDITTYF